MLRQSTKLQLSLSKTNPSAVHFHISLQKTTHRDLTTAPQPELQPVENSIKEAIQNKAYQILPQILSTGTQSWKQNNPFSFLSTFPNNIRNQIIDDMLQSFIPIRPRATAAPVYEYLLSYTLQSSKPLPISLAVLQRTLRSGLLPVPQTYVLLTSAWLNRRKESETACFLLKEMNTLKYQPDSGTCNYLISSLCSVDEMEEAITVLKSMSKAGCAPDLDSFCTVIDAMCSFGKTIEAFRMMKEMVKDMKVIPRQVTMKKLVGGMRGSKDCWRAVEVIEFLEIEGCQCGFETYEVVVEGCLECSEFVLAAKVVMKMTQRGFIPYFRIRQKVIEGLVSVGELELSFAVRQRFAELGS